MAFPEEPRIRARSGREVVAVVTPPPPPSGRPDPHGVRSEALRGVWRSSAVLAATLGLLSLAGPAATGDARAALLPGVPAAAVLLLHLSGATPRRRRGSMVLCTTVAGFLALSTVSSLGALDRLGTQQGPAVAFQVGCLTAALAFLARSVPAWRRVNEEGARADDLLRMYEELRGQYMPQNETERSATTPPPGRGARGPAGPKSPGSG